MNKQARGEIVNIIAGLMLLTLFVAWDVTNHPVSKEVMAQENTTVVSPTPISDTTIIKHSEVTIKEISDRKFITVKVSHYWPNLGGVNCLTFKNGKCVSKMANGQSWETAVDKAIACPKELKIGTKIKVLGKTWTCMDRGSAIVKTEKGAYWIDMLTEKAVVPYGEEVKAEVL